TPWAPPTPRRRPPAPFATTSAPASATIAPTARTPRKPPRSKLATSFPASNSSDEKGGTDSRLCAFLSKGEHTPISLARAQRISTALKAGRDFHTRAAAPAKSQSRWLLPWRLQSVQMLSPVFLLSSCWGPRNRHCPADRAARSTPCLP